MMCRTLLHRASVVALVAVAGLGAARSSSAADILCDPSNANCRTRLLAMIDNEQQGIDVGYWFMIDARYSAHIITRWQRGVPVRILMDTRANASNPGNDAVIAQFKSAGIPVRYCIAPGIMHWKAMIFAGQETVEVGSANYSDEAFVPVSPYTNYVAETVMYTDDPTVVDTFKRRFDDLWVDTSKFANYANVTSLARHYPMYTLDPNWNFPPSQDFGARSVARYDAETSWIDAIMFRITDRRHTDALIAAKQRGVIVRLIVDKGQYRDPNNYWDSWNVDRLYTAGVELRWQGHAGENHEKLAILRGQRMAIFGSSNWTGPSATSQQEHNYFTTKPDVYQWFVNQFYRMWHNSAGATETVPFAPLPPDPPVYKFPANGAAVTGTTVTLKWYGGPWAHSYDVYFGTSSSSIPKIAADKNLGPSGDRSTYQTYATPPLQRHTTYYWGVISKTMAGQRAKGVVWSFTTN